MNVKVENLIIEVVKKTFKKISKLLLYLQILSAARETRKLDRIL